ncbi:MAG: hypothetical protein Q8R00_03080 [Candidatus Nanoarchaeia archaeon]|nr:hypothetical protein [Candidatus Nanoarchaeia archaeon]
MTQVTARLNPEGVMDNFFSYNVKFFGHKVNKNFRKISGEDLVVDVLQNYLTVEPRYVGALIAVITSPNFDFYSLHDKAVEADIGHRVHWLMRDYIPALEIKGKKKHAETLKRYLPLFIEYTRSLENEIASYSKGRKQWIRNSASPVAKKCGVPIVYDLDKRCDRVDLYCKSA